MDGSTEIIVIDALSKSFGNVQALNSLTLKVKPGILGLIGPNGAGKTTILRILIGLLRPDSGKAIVAGYDAIRDSIEVRKRIRVLHEKAYYPPAMTPISFLRSVRRFYRSDDDIHEVLSLVGIADVANRQIRQLSAGMHQRLGLAQALIGEPELVFLDEPTSHLDVSGRDAVMKLIVQVHKESNVSFFISSHILSELERACQSVAFIKDGQILAYGPVKDIVHRHSQNRFQITTSDAHLLSRLLREHEGIEDALVLGIATVVVEISADLEIEIDYVVENVAERADIEIYKIEPSRSLDDVYRKVVSHE